MNASIFWIRIEMQNYLCRVEKSGHPESNQGPSDTHRCLLQSDALPTELCPGTATIHAIFLVLTGRAFERADPTKYSHLWGSNPGPSAYKADALPLS